MIALTETWLNGKDCDTELSLDGFGTPLRLDRDPSVTGKSQGGGVCLYVNNRWAKAVIIREKMCTADIELLTVSIRPFYLPREFQQVFVSVVYIHPKSDVQKATEIISQVVQWYQLRSPDAPHFIMGDFNKCSMEGVLNFPQYILTVLHVIKKHLIYVMGQYRTHINPFSDPQLVVQTIMQSLCNHVINQCRREQGQSLGHFKDGLMIISYSYKTVLIGLNGIFLKLLV